MKDACPDAHSASPSGTTFKEHIARKLPGIEGQGARITFHEQTPNGFTNLYLDDLEPLPDRPREARDADSA